MTTISNPDRREASQLVQVRPFLLRPTFAERIWGRGSLQPWYTDLGTDKPVGEAWLTGPDCVVSGGPLDGRKLKDVVAAADGLLGVGEFPLLVKMLFPNDKLSVQVHPDDEQAQELGLARGKTECWYVLEAEAGAQVACGLQADVKHTDVEAAIAAGTLESLMQFVPVEAGDMIFVDAGTIHAIGPGMTLLEVQQTCDVTYRLYDYGRPRELHLEAGLGALKLETGAGKREPKQEDNFLRLIEEKYFVVDLFELAAGLVREVAMDGLGCIVGIKGQGAVNEVRFKAGEAVVCPRGSMSISTVDGATFARCWQPQP